MIRIVLLLVVGVLLGGAGGGFWRAQRPAITVDSGAVARITDTLRTAPAGAVLLAGNSHAEIASAAPPACTALVNAGIGAATARSYADTLDRITEPARLRLGVLVIGTNDILRRDRPLSDASRAAFRGDAGRILAWLQARAGRVVVAAVPPIGAVAARKLEPAAVATMSAELRALCRPPGCGYVDPFVDLRDGASGLARAGTLSDGLHLADYPAMLAALGLCAADGRGPSLASGDAPD